MSYMMVSNFKFSNSSSVATCHRHPPECFSMFLYYPTVPRVIEPRTCTCIWSALCSSFIFSNPVSVRGYINNDLTKANNEVIRRHVYSALIDQKDDGMRKVLMYASARNSIPPLGFEEKIQLDYRSDGSSTFFAETCLLKLQVPVVFDSFNEFYKQLVFAVDSGYKGFGCV